MSIFRGSGVAIVTPMKENGEVNYDAYEALLEDQIKNHTDAVITVGTSGEAPTLDDDEHLEVIKFTVEVVKGRIPVIAGTGSNNTAHAIMMSEESEKLGADALLLVTPYYNKATQGGLIAHYSAIAQSTKLPCIVYNVPSSNVRAIKEASGNFSAIAELAHLSDGMIDIYSGNDDQVVPLCALGGVGVISVLANVAPKATHDMVQYCLDGNFAEAAKIQLAAQPLISALFCEVNPIPVKAALNMQGFNVGSPRLPLTEMEPAHKEILRKAMIEFGCLA